MIEDEIMERVNMLCQKYNISKYRLSKLTGISQSALSKMSKKQSTLSLITLEKICAAFGISLAQFFSDEGYYPDLTEEQKHLLEEWSALEPKQKEFLLLMLQKLKRRIFGRKYAFPFFSFYNLKLLMVSSLVKISARSVQVMA